MKYSLILAGIIFSLGCASGPQPTDSPVMVQGPVQVEAPVEVNYKSMFPRSEWKQMTLDALDKYGKDLLAVELPKDAETFGFRGKTLEDRKAFWVYFISAMAWRESGFKPETSYAESGKLAGVISRGLLQISLESGQSYNKSLKTVQELHDPKINLETGVMILNRWVSRDGYIAHSIDSGKRDSKGNIIYDHKGAARYWSVVRPHSKSRANIIAKMKAAF